MKRKAIYIISMLITMLLVSSLVVYAAFVMTHNYEADINHHVITIDKTQLGMVATDNTTTDNTLSFANPGDKVTITYTLSNPDTRNYEYYYTLSTTATDQKLLNMIYVYQDDVYCGVLSECLKKGLLEPEYIFAGESTTNTTARTNTLEFELHNGASSYINGEVTLPITVTCNIKTTNYQNVLFADSDTTAFTKIIDDINSFSGKTIVLTNNVTTTEAYTIANNCTIDLCGNTLTLGADVTIAPGVEVEIIDSRANGAVAGAGKFVLNSEDSFIKLETKVSQIKVDNYNKTRLMEELAKQYANDSYIVQSNSAYDLLGVYSVYGAIPNSSEVIIETGVIQAATTALDTNEVIGIVYFEGDSTYETVFEFNYIGSDNTVFAEIINIDLAHLKQFSTMNGIQVANHTFLPNVVKEHNATISWHSSNPMIIDENGIVGSQQGNVVLTATIKVYDKVFIQKYYMYVVQQDNLSKLQYLASQVERGTMLNINGEDKKFDVLLNKVYDPTNQTDDGSKPLPIAGSSNVDAYNYYTKWTNGELLGIVELNYEISNIYDYVTLDVKSKDFTGGQLIEDKILSDARVYLNKITYSRAAMVKIIGLFDNGETEETFITIRIDLAESTLANSVFGDVQTYLNSVDVLQNILDTRATMGTLKESGDFELPKSINVIELDYESLDSNLYEIVKTYVEDSKGYYIKNADGDYVIPATYSEEDVRYSIDKINLHFIDLSYLSLSDKACEILCKIKVVSNNVESNPAVKTLRFVVPGAITPRNIKDFEGNTIFDLNNDNIKRIFYSFKYQTLQQSDSPIYSITKTDDETTTTNLVDVKNIDDIYKLGQYILMYDAENTERLIFEYNKQSIIVDYYDLNTFVEIIKWATAADNTPVKVLDSKFSLSVDDGIGWIPSDGKSTLSDEEITVILSYAERFPGFLEMWNQKVNVLDNTLSDSDVNQLLELLIKDKYFVPILNWLRNETNSGIDLYTWLYMIDETSPLFDAGVIEITSNMKNVAQANTGLPDLLLSLSNASGASVTNNEERVIVYYVMNKYGTSTEAAKKVYSSFYEQWKYAITRSADADTTVRSITTYRPKTITISYSKALWNSNPSIRTIDASKLKECYDPIFIDLIDWITYSTNSNSFSTLNLEKYGDVGLGTPKNQWGQDNYYVYEQYGDRIGDAEWTALWTYLGYYGIDRISVDGFTYIYGQPEQTSGTTGNNGNIIVDTVTSNTLSYLTNNGGTNLSKILTNSDTIEGYRMTENLINALITSVNNKYASVTAEYNELVVWSKNTSIGLQAWDDVVTKTISTLDSYRIKDCMSNISYDEYYVLIEYFKSQFTSVIPNENLRNVMMKYYISSIMEMPDSTISPTDYSNILGTINDNIKFDEMVEESKKLGTSAPTGIYDNVPTLSANELKAIATEYKDVEGFVSKLNQIISAYDITIDASGNVVVTQVTTNMDRELTGDDKTALEDLINQILGQTEDTNKITFKYISIGQITESEIETFNIFSYYKNLDDLMFRGSSSVFLFKTTKGADLVFNIVSNSCKTLEKLTINYVGLSNIDSVSKLLTLEHLDLRGNYTVGNYKGISDISSLIVLNDLKKIANTDDDSANNVEYLRYLNVYNTDVLFSIAEVTLANLYEINESAALWYSHDGIETKYPKTNFATDDELAYHILSLLYEIGEMRGKYIVLPQNVYTLDANGTAQTYSITWTIKDAKSIIRMNNNYNRIDRLDVTLEKEVEVIISASVQINDKLYYRYFVITVS